MKNKAWIKGILLVLALTAAEGMCASTEESKPEYKHVDLVLVLDKSGSMHGLESDTIGGFNSMLDKQRKLDVKTDVTTVLFNHNMTTLHARKNIAEIEKLTDRDYFPDGMTALLDSVGQTISTVDTYKDVAEKDNKVIFVIITDGMENSSKEYTRDSIKSLISKKQEQGWEFVFLGANIDAVSEAGRLGINKDNAVKYQNTEKGVRANYDAIASFAAEAINSDAVKGEWKKEVVEDKK